TSKTGNLLIADEPIDKGGKDLGFSPKELLASALAACTSATVRMYADRKDWDLQELKINIALDIIPTASKTVINKTLEFIGNLNEAQKSRLHSVANSCPIHKMLIKPIEIYSQLK